MTWKLYRGDDLLGTLHERSVLNLAQQTRQGGRHVNAVLVPDPMRLPLPSVRQNVVEWGGSRTVMEHIQEPDIAANRPRETGPSEPAYGVWVVPPSPTAPPPGVPADRRLQVRDEAGHVVPTRYVTVREHRPDPAHLPPELATFPKDALVGESVWLVAFTEDSDAART